MISPIFTVSPVKEQDDQCIRRFLTDKSSHNHNSRVDFIFTLVLAFDESTIKNKYIKKNTSQTVSV